jgi:hypothetical protein
MKWNDYVFFSLVLISLIISAKPVYVLLRYYITGKTK